MKGNETSKPDNLKMQIEIGSVSTHGHFVIAGQDANVSGSLSSDVSNTHVVKVGGVETSQEEFLKLEETLKQIEQAIEEEDISDDEKEAAIHNVRELKSQMTSPQKPNSYILAQAAERLYQHGPKLAGAIVRVFATPLAGSIVTIAGAKALQFYRSLTQQHPDEF